VPLLRSSGEVLLRQMLAGQAVPRLQKQFLVDVGYRPAAAEVRSWESSLPVLLGDLRDADLDHVEVLVEHKLPLSSKRADAVLCGVHPRTGEPSFVVVELKQWSRARVVADDQDLVLIDAYRDHPVLHPARQVQNYVDYMIDFVSALREREHLVRGAAYLHNASEPAVRDLRQRAEDERARMFSGEQRGAWLEFLRDNLAPESGAEAADLLLGSAVAPSKQLMRLAAQEIGEREQFVLLDEQEVAYRIVMNAVKRAAMGDHKTVIMVTGGPGSGKSVIALSVLGELYRQGRTAEHATGSRAFTKTLRRVYRAVPAFVAPPGRRTARRGAGSRLPAGRAPGGPAGGDRDGR